MAESTNRNLTLMSIDVTEEQVQNHTPTVVFDSPLLRLRAADRAILRAPAYPLGELASALPYEYPAATLNDRKRKWADSSHIRPLGPLPSAEREEIQLSSIRSQSREEHPGTTTAIQTTDDGSRADVAHVGDVEGGPSTQTPSAVPTEADLTAQPPAVSPEERALQKRKGLMHFSAICWAVFVVGWCDGTTGPMLPRLQAHYHIGFAVVSLVFVTSACGFFLGAMANVYLTDKFGFGKVLLIGAVLQAIAFTAISPAGPFPLLCCAFVLSGFGLSLLHAHANGFVAALNSPTKMGIMHGVYGSGALVAPLVSTQFAKSDTHWSFHYIITVGLYLSVIACSWLVFRGKRQEVILEESGEKGTDDEATNTNKYKQILSLKEVHFIAAFALIYVGVEVTMGGWSVTYILEERHGSSSSGYIASGFFGGLMLGRVSLMWLNKMLGNRLALFLYAVVAIGLEITVWLIPSLLENAIAVALVGLVMGPMYPILMLHSTTILPRWLLTGCVGYIASIGQAGSAMLPFLTGLLASKFGIASLQPFIVSMISTLIVIWAVIPRARYVPA
ncbi:MFS general substrate transporter [Lentinus brumalis]|uniref:MFS general substrate transporter n=1 Tax=Lentinus brumalis TaxID=2498619 RepID=A0A371D3T7_9APHY|nr:MFS general substrate transporter [Polyporus brumalis]